MSDDQPYHWEFLYANLSPNYCPDDPNFPYCKFSLDKNGRIRKAEKFTDLECKIHDAELAHMVSQLLNATLPPGVILRGGREDDIYCVLCDEQIAYSFGLEFHNHINSDTHQLKAEENTDKQKLSGLDLFFEDIFTEEIPHNNALIRMVNCSSIIVDDDGRFCCSPCNNYTTTVGDLDQLDTHLHEEKHRIWAFHQLEQITSKLGFESQSGITVKNGLLYCEFCQCQLGSSLATTEAYYHCSVTKHLCNWSTRFSNGLNKNVLRECVYPDIKSKMKHNI